MAAVGLDEAWDRLIGPLEFSTHRRRAIKVLAGPNAPTALTSTVERAAPLTVPLRIREPGPGTALLAVGHRRAGRDQRVALPVRADASGRPPALLESWQEWLAHLFRTPG